MRKKRKDNRKYKYVGIIYWIMTNNESCKIKYICRIEMHDNNNIRDERGNKCN